MKRQEHIPVEEKRLQGRRFLRGLLILSVSAGLFFFGWLLNPGNGGHEARLEPTLEALSTELAAANSAQGQPEEPAENSPATLQPQSISLPAADQIVVFTAFSEGYQHLFATVPGSMSSIPLTTGSFDDADPALSRDGTQLAFRSNRSGNWELYLLELSSGNLRQLTDTPGYEGDPTWSPDGRWLAYEAYHADNLDIWIMSLEPGRTPIQLTNHPGLDSAPSWDPNGGRQIAFISNREGSADVFLANLDLPENRFKNLTGSPDWDERDPAFHPDGSAIAYGTDSQGLRLVWQLKLEDRGQLPRQIGAGTLPSWSPDGNTLAVVQADAHSQRVVTYDFEGISAGIGLVQQGPALQFTWSQGASNQVVAAEGGAAQPLAALPTEASEAGLGRRSLIDLNSVQSINAKLIQEAQIPFEGLRAAIARRVGWDFLASLEAAFVGLNDPLPPGFAYNDWLYTGRAFAFESSAIEAGWVKVVPEEYGGRHYWRVYVRAAEQDGSLGHPLYQRTWDFDARYSGDPSDYDAGGVLSDQVPDGYYVDFTGLAEAYGFERQPALINWRSFYPGARFNEFAFTEGLDWRSAMLQLYPAEAIATPTAFSSPTPTPTNTRWPTPTPWWLRWRTPTPVPPTITPIPSATIALSP